MQSCELEWKIAKSYYDARFRQGCVPRAGRTGSELLFVYLPGAIGESQCYPFYKYRTSLAREYGLDFRCVPLDRFLEADPVPNDRCAVLLFQSSCDLSQRDIELLGIRMRTAAPSASLVYCDCFAPLDVRFLAPLSGVVDKYVKKQVFRDASRYSVIFEGDTNLMDYYGKRFKLRYQSRTQAVSNNMLKKLVLGPQFFTAPGIMQRLQRRRKMTARVIDLHARIATSGSEWYRLMRSEAMEAVRLLRGCSLAAGARVSRRAYLRELSASLMTLSPFGYGEICWRDYEAIACGSLLLKPDMSHVRTEPDIFVPYETYVPLKWDWSDLQEVVSHYRKNPSEAAAIAAKAHAVLQRYLRDERFLTQWGPVLRREGKEQPQGQSTQASRSDEASVTASGKGP